MITTTIQIAVYPTIACLSHAVINNFYPISRDGRMLSWVYCFSGIHTPAHPFILIGGNLMEIDIGNLVVVSRGEIVRLRSKNNVLAHPINTRVNTGAIARYPLQSGADRVDRAIGSNKQIDIR